MKKTITYLLAFGFLLLSSVGWGQETVFNECVPTFTELPAGWTSNNGGGVAIFQSATGGYLLVDHIDDWVITSNYDLSNYQDLVLNVSVATYGSGDNNPLTVDVSNDGGATWMHQTLTSNTPTSSTYIAGGPFTITADGTQVKFRFRRAAASGKGVRFRDIHLTGILSSVTPTISISPTSLTDFTYIEGNGPSAEQSFTVSGADLTENISLVPPANYEISTGTGGGFVATDPITLAHTAGTVNATTIYVRLKAGLAAGTYNSQNVTANSTGATEKTVALSGSVIAPATTTLPYEEPFTADLGDAYVYTVAGTNPWAFVTGTAEADGFGGQNPEEHWLVLPGINFGDYTNEYMTFTNYAQFGTIDPNNYLKLYYSSDYAGVGDPTGATWTELSFDQPAAGAVGSTMIETASGQINLSGLPDAQVFIAFKYFSTDAPVRWRVDEILIREDKWPVTFYVDMTNAGTFTNVDIAGDFNNWGDPVVNMSLVQNNIYSYTTSTVFAAGTELTFKFRKDGNWSTAEPDPNRTYTVLTGDNVYHAVYGVQVYAEISYANLQWPPSGTITQGDDYNVFARVYANGLTGEQGDVPNLQAWIGYSTENTNPSTWSNWVAASYNSDFGNNEEYTANLGIINAPGVYYYASRFKLGEAGYVYGGYSAEGGGMWNGTTNVNGQLTIQNPEPTNHPTNFTASANTSTTITVGWTDAVPAADGYLIKGSTGNYTNITAPTDGLAESNSLLVQNVTSSVESHTFTGLTPSTAYYFKIYPYNGSGGSINYKTDESVQQTSGTTAEGGGVTLMINEVDADTDGTDVLEFVELFDGGVGSADLTGYVLVFYNGSNDLSYAAFDLDGYSTDLNGYFVIGNSGVSGVDLIFANGTLQNGADAVALYQADGTDFPVGTAVTTTDLIDAFVYDTNDPDDAGLLVLLNPGQAQIDESGRGNSAALSMQRIPNGSGGVRNSSTYALSYPTPKAENMIFNAAWIGATNDQWVTSTNWQNGIIPMTGDDITIGLGSNNPLFTSAEEYQSLTIDNGAVLTLSPSAQLTVNGTLTNNAGTSGLVIQSTDAGTGSLIHNSNGVAATVQRYVSGGTISGKDPVNYKYHLLSVPLAANIQAGDAFANTYLWEFDPNTQAWSGITSLTHPIAVNKGYLGYVATENHTYSFTGNLFNGDFTAAAETVANGDFKLVPNPYPSAIDWELVTKNGINNAIYFFNSATGNYVSYLDAELAGGTQFIPAGQSFFVQASEANPTVSFGNAARVHNSQAFYKSGQQSYKDVLQITVATTNAADETFIRFRPQASNSFDGKTDATKLQGFEGAPQLYTMAEDFTALSINTMETSAEAVVVPLAFELNYDSEMTLNFHYLESFEASVDILLEDLLTNAMIDLREIPAYTFSHVATNDPMRFKLHFAGVTSIEDQPEASHHRMWTTDGMLYLLLPEHNEEEITIDLFDLQGRLLESTQLTAGRLHAMPLSQRGMLVARFTAGTKVYTSKLFIR